MNTIKDFYLRHIDARSGEYRTIFNTFLKGKKRILDAGCGVGKFIGLDPKHIEGIDQNAQSLRIAREQGFLVKKGTLDRLPYNDTSFDGIFCAHVIEHLYPDTLIAALYEFDRILKQKGLLIITTPLFYSRFYNDATHIRPYPPESLLEYLIDTPQISTQRTAVKKKTNYMIKHLSYRYNFLYYPYVESSRFPHGWKRWSISFCKIVSMILYKIGIKNYFSKTGYTIVLEKL